MTGSIFQAFNSVKNFFYQFPPFTGNNHRHHNHDGGERVNGGVNHFVDGGIPATRLFSLGGGDRSSRKRPSERVIYHEIELELTDDEDDASHINNNYSQSWSGYRRQAHLPKRFKSSLPEDDCGHLNNMTRTEKVVTRGSGQNPAIPGLPHQPWEFSFPNFGSKSKKNTTTGEESSHNELPSASTSSSSTNAAGAASSSQPSGSKTDFSSFRFTQPSNATKQTKNIEVITINDDEPFSYPEKTSTFRQSAFFNKKKPENIVRKPITKHKSTFMSCLNNVGRKAVDPISSTIRLEERNRYRDLIDKMNSVKHPFFGRQSLVPLQRSKLDSSQVRALYHNWPNSSPSVSLKFGSSLKQTPSISDRVKNDLRLFSTPTASRSSGSTPIGPTSPPVLIDLEEEEKSHRSSNSRAICAVADLSLSASFADLDDALSSTKFEHDKNQSQVEDESGTVAVIGEAQEEQPDDDISILSESIYNKYQKRRINSLALEQNLSPYVNRSWLNGVSNSFRDSQKKREQEIKEHLETVDVLNKESTLEKDLREDIRRKLRLTEIIVLEEPPEKLPDITDDMRVIIDTAKRPGREDDILATIFNIGFTRGDVKTLAPCKWLNDNVINAYMELIVHRSNQENSGLPKVYAFTTFFYPKLLKEGYSNLLKRWTRKVDIFSNDLLVFPIHLGLHWCLACADLRSKTVKYYDSLGGRNDKCLNALLNYMAMEMKERKGEALNKYEWSYENVEDVPQQQNGSDCGVFTCKFAEYLSRDANLTFVQENMNYYRDRMIYEIIQKDLLFP